MKSKVVLEPSDEGGYTVCVPSLPACISEGDTLEEALANMRETIELYLEPVEEMSLLHSSTAQVCGLLPATLAQAECDFAPTGLCRINLTPTWEVVL